MNNCEHEFKTRKNNTILPSGKSDNSLLIPHSCLDDRDTLCGRFSHSIWLCQLSLYYLKGKIYI